MPQERPEPEGIGVGSVLLDKYELRALIGEGASGRVFEAIHKKTGGLCAVKLLHRGASESDRERMRREAQALARLDHRAIVRLLDYDELPAIESAFIVQELVRGRTLRAVLDEELVLPANHVVEIALALLDALAYAHERGVIHRDIKPENIVLAQGSDGALSPKLVDFGLVRDEQNRTNLTRHGSIAGTPRYMSPEQAWGREDLDARTDLWSLGVVLYEALSGAPPYDGGNDREVLASIVARDPVHLRSVGVAVDDALADAVMLALVRAPEARVSSAKALHRAIGAAQSGSVASEPEPESKPDSRPELERVAPRVEPIAMAAPSAPARWPWIVAFAALLAVVIVGFTLRSRGSSESALAVVRPEPASDAAVFSAIDVVAQDTRPEPDAAERPRDAAADAVERRRTGAQRAGVRRYDAGAQAEERSGRGANGSPIINEL
ncbi:MAG: protein kinase [Polyangiales bacterium]